MRSEAGGFGRSELTLSASEDPSSALPTSPFLDSFRFADDTPGTVLAVEQAQIEWLSRLSLAVTPL